MLSPGERVGAYEIRGLLGKGGMGEVYRAADLRLGREVALKVLPAVFAGDADRMARFHREAQVLASLNHPLIATLYGLEESGGIRALVMELVEGPTLAETLSTRRLETEEVVRLAWQIAEALEAAHEKGVVHRDLKPANIKITPTGAVKVLDFGLAKALEGPVSGEAAEAPTLSLSPTRAGVLLGTPAYMSPEQAKGKPADRRADIWAFGVVLYEMLAGRPLHSGETVSEIIASVIKDAPDWERLPRETPAAVRRLLRRCLERDTRRRLRDIGEARIVLEDVVSGTVEQEALPAPPPSAHRSRAPFWAAGLLLAGVASGVLTWMLKPEPPEVPLRKFDLPTEKLRAAPVISPDGRRIAYTAAGRLWVRELDQLEPRALPATDDPCCLFWSPDSAFIGYVADSRLWKIAVSGGQPNIIAAAPGLGSAGAAWAPDGRIVFASAIPETGLSVVSAQGGDLAVLLPAKKGIEQDFHEPGLLPDGRGVLFVIDRGGGLSDTIALLSQGSSREILRLNGETLSTPVYSPTGHILYHRERNNPGIWALPFSLEKLARQGEPFLVAPHGHRPSVSRDGTLAFTRPREADRRQLAWLDRGGKLEMAGGEPQEGLGLPELSPDGRLAAVVVSGERDLDVWIHDLARRTRYRLTFAGDDEVQATWSRAGDRILYTQSNFLAGKILSKPADGSGQPQTVAEGVWATLSPDGKYLAVVRRDPKTLSDLWYVPLQGAGKPAPFLQAAGFQLRPRFSSDGRYLAYVSNESGRFEVFVRPFPGGEGQWQVSFTGGRYPRWSRDGSKLYYSVPTGGKDHLTEVDVTLGPPFRLGVYRRLFSPPGPEVDFANGFDVAADGKRFLVVQDTSAVGGRPASITVVQNWFAEFRGQAGR